MTSVTYKRTSQGVEVVSSEIVEPTGIPFNPDGFINIIAKNFVKELLTEKETGNNPHAD
jgi:hypothetical protein